MPAVIRGSSPHAFAAKQTSIMNPQPRIQPPAVPPEENAKGEYVAGVFVQSDAPLAPDIKAAMEKIVGAGKQHMSASLRCVSTWHVCIGSARNV